jgi:hypothetical protein
MADYESVRQTGSTSRSHGVRFRARANPHQGSTTAMLSLGAAPEKLIIKRGYATRFGRDRGPLVSTQWFSLCRGVARPGVAENRRKRSRVFGRNGRSLGKGTPTRSSGTSRNYQK